MTSDTEIATLNQDQSLNSLFHSGVDGLISSTTTQGTSYYSYNPHSDASLITDESGNTKSQLHYDAWGNVQEQTNESYNYLGKYQRRTYSSPGLIKMGARFYDPNTGRFISRDPEKGQDETPISHNPYIYAYDDPVNMKDLSGMSPIGDALRRVGNVLWKCGLYIYAAHYYWLAYCYDMLEARKTPEAQTPQEPNCPVAVSLSGSRKWQTPKIKIGEWFGWITYYGEVTVRARLATAENKLFEGSIENGKGSLRCGDLTICPDGVVYAAKVGTYTERSFQGSTFVTKIKVWPPWALALTLSCRKAQTFSRPGCTLGVTADWVTEVQLNRGTSLTLCVLAASLVATEVIPWVIGSGIPSVSQPTYPQPVYGY
jgi:RHS repeat-associated protein